MDGMIWLGRKAKNIFIGIDEDRICASCEHFHKHYVKNDLYVGKRSVRDSRTGDFFSPICWGHCAYPRLKGRNALDSCEHFKERATDGQARET